MHVAHASPRAFLFVGRFAELIAELAALVAAAPPQSPVFHLPPETGVPRPTPDRAVILSARPPSS